MLIIASCVSEEEPVEIPISDAQQAVEDAKAWFGPQEEFVVQDNLNNPSAKRKTRTKKIQWNKAITHEDGKVIEVAVSYSAHSIPMRNDTTVASLKEKQKRAFYRLLICKDSIGNFSKSLLKFFPETRIEGQSQLEMNNFMSLSSQFSGDIQLTDWDENLEMGWYVKEGIPIQKYFPEQVSGKKRENFIGASLDCTVTTYQICDFVGDDEAEATCEDGIGCTLPTVDKYCYTVYSTSGCDEEDPEEGGPGWYGGPGGGPTGPVPGGSPGGSNPGGGGYIPSDEEGINCSSFIFSNVNSAWREAGVSRIRFNVVYLDGSRRESKNIEIPRPIYFGLPIAVHENPYEAAEFTAGAVQRASDLTFNLVEQNPGILDYTIQTRFMEFLQGQMSLYEGSAKFYPSDGYVGGIIEAKYTIGNGDCN